MTRSLVAAPGAVRAPEGARKSPPVQMPLIRSQHMPDWPWMGCRDGDAALEPWAYQVIMADPPWRFENYSDKGQAKGPEPHYATMTDEDILGLRVDMLAAPDAMLWLWATWPKLDLAMRCLRRWNARYVTGGCWDKRRWGTGYVLRSRCEPFLIATWGRPEIDGRSVANLIEETRGRHSVKPEAAFAAAERMMPGARRVEIFSRRGRLGWEAWGLEAGSTDGQANE